MKSLAMLAILFLQTAAFGQAKLEVDKDQYKFEDTPEGTLLTATFVLTNTGNAPLLINDYKVACPCTKAELPKSPILPGKSYTMEVTFDTKGKDGWQDRAILLQTNTKKKEEKLRIKVYVYPMK